MPWTSTKDGLQTRYRLSGGWGLGGILATLLTIVLFGAFGPGLLGVGSMILDVRCERGAEGPAANCSVSEGYLFGRVPFSHQVSGVTGVSYATSRGSKGTSMSRLAFETTGEAVPLITVSSNMNDSEKREIKRAIEAYLAGPEKSLALHTSLYNVFALFGAPLTLVWLVIIWGLLTAPLGLIWRAGIDVDPMARVLWVRTKPGPRPRREIRLGDLAAIEASSNPGGWLGRLVEMSPVKPMQRGGKTPELHLHLVLRDGERVVIRNLFKIPDESMHALRKHLAEASGVATS